MSDDLHEILKEWTAPPSSEATQTRIITMLTQEMSPKRSPAPWLILRSQAKVVQREIWFASLMVMVLGIWVILLNPTNNYLVLVMIAPVIAAWGMAMLFNDETEIMLSLERATPTHSTTLLLARMTLVFGTNLMVGFALSFLTMLIIPGTGLWELILLWLGPMTLLSAFAFLWSVLSGDSIFGGAFSMMLWVIYNLIRLNTTLLLPDFSQMIWLLVAGVLAASALWIAHKRMTMGEVF